MMGQVKEKVVAEVFSFCGADVVCAQVLDTWPSPAITDMSSHLRPVLLLSAALQAAPAALPPVAKSASTSRGQPNVRHLEAAKPSTTNPSSATKPSSLDDFEKFGGDFYGDDLHGMLKGASRFNSSGFKYTPPNYNTGSPSFDELDAPSLRGGYRGFGSSWWDEFKFDMKYRTKETVMKYLANGLLVLLVSYCLLTLFRPYGADIVAFWRRRRMAAKYKRVKKNESDAELSASEEEIGLFEVVASSLTADKYLDCVVDLGDAKPARTCSVDVADLERTSELVFKIADGLKASGDIELAAVSLVDLYLKDRVRLEYVAAKGGDTKLVGKANVTTPDMLRNAKSFRVTVLPQTTR